MVTNLQNDTFLIAQFLVPDGVDIQMNLISNRFRSVEIENHLVKVKIVAERMPITGGMPEPLMVIDVKKDGFLMDLKSSVLFGEIVSAALTISKFMQNHPRWQN